MAKKDYSMVPAADGGEDLYVLETPMLNETGSPLIYPFGFAPTLHRYRMNIPEKLKMGNNIFVGAMSDVFGAWVPDEWIKEIFGICKKYPIHHYLFLTKNPERYKRLDTIGILPADKNLWYGSTLTISEDTCFISNAHNTFWNRRFSLPSYGALYERLRKYDDLKEQGELLQKHRKTNNESLSEYQKAQKWLESYDWDDKPEADDNLTTICVALQEMEEYEELERQGRLLKLPCKVGE